MSESFNSVYLSVVIPVYNESRLIAETVRRVEAFLVLKNKPWEIIVADDGSTDETAAIVRGLIEKRGDDKIRLINLGKNTGKGAAVRKGVLAAKGDFVLISDADLSSPIKECDKLLNILRSDASIAVASRAIRVKGCDVRQSFKRHLAGRVFNALVKIIVLGGFSDTQCGFKCFKKEAAGKIFGELTLNRFGFDVEALLLARRAGYRVEEIPVMWKEGLYSKVRLLKDSFAMIGELFYLRRKYGYTR